MRRYVGWAAYLYPAEWRARYGAEFNALLDDARLEWRDLPDVVRGAAMMRMTACMSYWKIGLLAGLLGAIVAVGISFAIADQYVATAALQLANRTEAKGASRKTTEQPLQTLQQLQLEVLGRDNVIALIQNPRLDLYPEQRKRMPVEEIAHEVLRKHLRIMLYEGPGSRDVQAFRILFEYPDKYKARAVVAELVSMFQRRMAFMQATAGSPDGPVMSILEAPLLPETPTYPARGSSAVAGAIAGMMMGLISLKLWRRTRNYAVVTMSIPRDTKAFVDRQVGSGQYASAGEYVRELIRADEQRKARSSE